MCVALWFGYAAPAAAAPTTAPYLEQTLAGLGYTDDLVFSGARAQTRFAFPLPEAGIASGTLTLNLRLSNVLAPNSTVQVFVNDQPVLSLTAAQAAKKPVLTLPVAAANTPYLAVRVVGNLFTDEAQCQALTNDSLWMTVANTSGLRYTLTTAPASIRSFLQLPGGEVRVQGLWDTPQQQADSIALFSTLKYAYRGTPTDVVLAEDAASTPASEGMVRTVALAPAADATPFELKQNQLTVAPSRSAFEELLGTTGQPLLLGSSVAALQTAPTPVAMPNSAVHRLALTQLGLADQERSGTGELPVSIRFTLSDFGGWPRDLVFHLSSAFDSVTTGTAEQALVRVQLNGTLIDTVDIRKQATLERDIVLPSALLQSQNYLNVAFVYAPLSGNCSGSDYSFIGQIHGSSTLSWTGLDASRHQIAELIGPFKGEGELLLLDQSPQTALAAARLYGGLSMFTAAPLLPKLVEHASLAQPTTAAYRVVLGGDSATAQTLKLPLDITQQIVITNPQTSKVVLQGQPDQPFVAFQYSTNATPTLIVQRSAGADAALLDAAVKRAVDPEHFFALNGDAAIGDATQLVALDLTGDTFQVQQAQTSAFASQLPQYRWVIIVLAAVLIGGMWWQVYQRVGRRPPMPVVPSEQ